MPTDAPSTRTVTLVLVDGAGTVLGALAPFESELPWWQETTDVVRLARLHRAVDVTVLRLLRAERPEPPGGAVTYLARVEGAIPAGLAPVDEPTLALASAREPLRPAYAELDGPADTLAWAREVLGPVRAEQQRTWNLSAIWRLESAAGVSWLKQVPEFFGHEPAVLTWLARVVPDLGPVVQGVGDAGRMLLQDVGGQDLYATDAATRVDIAARAHRIQTAALDATEELVSLGVPDRRGASVVDWIRSTLAPWADGHRAEQLLADLDEAWARIQECGLPDTLVHGDAHPGNVQRAGDRLVFLDWGDSIVGHPGFDALVLVTGMEPADQAAVLAAWADLWRRSVPGSDPGRALELLRPVSLLRSAAVYADFVARIEPTERPYHRADVPAGLDAAVAAGR